MPELLVPRLSVAPSAREAARGTDWDEHPTYAGLAGLTDAELPGWVESLVTDSRPHASRPPGATPATNLWWVDGDTYLGRVQVRHHLTHDLREAGGHVGYHVVAAHRRRGHATAMLAATLPVAAQLGLDCVLVTCDADNAGSRRTIEANGGLFHDQRGVKLRYWVPTA
ncbi:GNAT family N-acetyltransferase [Modestobacter italicus]|uniref:GNAT family N-acetyltransferase n=1 Tax=Modestobacter italicus (strain DSM 44449 / CECT 9708 / BC 501) TaxID=2732864 RepID=UPI001C9600DC|nr:GNAT family N-acetyltransferase [Modestobacter italicus]